MGQLGSELGLDDPSVSWKGVEGGPELRRGPAQHSQDQDWAQGGTNSPRGLLGVAFLPGRGLREVNSGQGQSGQHGPR